jgi:hypothetical protein
MTDVEPEVRTCDKCGQQDNEPHHVQYVANNPASPDLSVSKHVRCCAEDGCPICTADVHAAEQAGFDPEHLSDFVQHRPEDHQQRLHDEFGVESPDVQAEET